MFSSFGFGVILAEALFVLGVDNEQKTGQSVCKVSVVSRFYFSLRNGMVISHQNSFTPAVVGPTFAISILFEAYDVNLSRKQ